MVFYRLYHSFIWVSPFCQIFLPVHIFAYLLRETRCSCILSVTLFSPYDIIFFNLYISTIGFSVPLDIPRKGLLSSNASFSSCKCFSAGNHDKLGICPLDSHPVPTCSFEEQRKRVWIA